MAMKSIRPILSVVKARPTMEGAGVRLCRAIGGMIPIGGTAPYDPFLLLDDFGSANHRDYMAGFPPHPHRGMETVTYVLNGEIEHKDSLGNNGLLKTGGVQWMTAGSGIIHSEMPHKCEKGVFRGFQLWVNLPQANKMMSPRYQDIPADKIPTAQPVQGVSIKVIAGEVGGVTGPVKDVVAQPLYLDVSLAKDTVFEHSTPAGHTVFAYVVAGSGYFHEDKGQLIEQQHCVHFGKGDTVRVSAGPGAEGLRYLFVAGQPIREPVAWQGPIVMNTGEELDEAFLEVERGTFVKTGAVRM